VSSFTLLIKVHRLLSFFLHFFCREKYPHYASPNGATRSYTPKPEILRKAEARAAAAATAVVDMGAIDGSPEPVAKRGLMLAPLDAPGSVDTSPNDAGEDPAVKEVEKCCIEWRAGRVKPRWIFLIQCALQVKLSMHLFRVLSVDVVHLTFEAAKAMCAADAISERIFDFIKFGNGPTAPAERRLFQKDDTMSAPPPVALTLQGFFEALPHPLPEPVDDKVVAEINAPGWRNGLLQSARGGKFEHKFIWTNKGSRVHTTVAAGHPATSSRCGVITSVNRSKI